MVHSNLFLLIVMKYYKSSKFIRRDLVHRGRPVDFESNKGKVCRNS